MNKPFRITIEHWDQKVISEVNRSDLTLKEVIQMFERLLLAAGFSQEQIEKYYE